MGIRQMPTSSPSFLSLTDNSRPTSTGSPCNKTMSMSVSFRSGQTTETASLVSSSAAVTADNNGTGSTTSPVDLTAKGLGLCPGQARNRGHSVCLEDEGRSEHHTSRSASLPIIMTISLLMIICLLAKKMRKRVVNHPFSLSSPRGSSHTGRPSSSCTTRRSPGTRTRTGGR